MLNCALIDTDVIYKASLYGLALNVLKSEPYGATQFSALGASEYMVRGRLKKQGASTDTLEDFFSACTVLEPTPIEIAIASDLEFAARTIGLSLDEGESILCAIFIQRNGRYLFTGDKRAINAIEQLFKDEHNKFQNAVVCLEQIFLWLIRHYDVESIRAQVCATPTTDRALSICFACASSNHDLSQISEGLSSYIEALRQDAKIVLAK